MERGTQSRYDSEDETRTADAQTEEAVAENLNNRHIWRWAKCISLHLKERQMSLEQAVLSTLIHPVGLSGGILSYDY